MEKEDVVYSSNEDIIGGLKSAVSRGEDLKQAMMSFYNAGYTKQEIEDAARKYLMEKTELKKDTGSLKKIEKKEDTKNNEEKEKAKKEIKPTISELNSTKTGESISSGAELKKEQKKSLFQMFKPKQNKKISEYDFTKKRKTETITLVLTFLLIFLIAILGVVFLFKNELIGFFNKLLG
jgi:type VII secretion protein EssA